MPIPPDDTDNQIFNAPGRSYSRRSIYPDRQPVVLQRRIHDIVPISKPPSLAVTRPVTIVAPVVQQTATAEPPQILKHKKSKTGLLLVVMAGVLFIFGSSVALWQFKSNKQVIAQVKQAALDDGIQGDGPPSENKPTKSTLSSYDVPATQPKRLTIPKLSVNARVRQLNTNSQNQLQAPASIYDTGWYQKSSKPGDAGGAILIDGHVHGPTQKGVFYDLDHLVQGDIIKLTRGDNKTYSFKVVKLQTYDASNTDMAAAMVSVTPGKLGLNLITCTGSVNATGNGYNQRLIVFAVQQ